MNQTLGRVLGESDKPSDALLDQWGKTAQTIAGLMADLTDADLVLLERLAVRLHDGPAG